jgi:heme-degrading monooxygenase HmoA
VIVEVGLFCIDRGRTGVRSFHLAHAVEDVGRWAVLVGWDSIADHERFVASDEGERQRGLLGQFITETPEVFHLSLDDLTEGLR